MSTSKRRTPWLWLLGALCLLSFVAPAQGDFVVGDAIHIDFGAGSTTSEGNWNNMTSAAGTIENAITDSGSVTAIDFAMVDRYNGVNESGTTEPDEALGLPASATRDSFYGNDVVWGGLIEPTAQLVISGLDPSTSYQLTFFCSRMGAGDNRQTEYAISGDGGLVETLYLDPAENTDTDVTSKAIRPNANGEIIIDMQKGPDNNNSYGFFYLGALTLRVVQNLSATQPTPASGATDVARDVVLGWTAGQFAATHNVYFGTDLEAVSNASVDNPLDVLVSESQADETYDPGMALELGQTYYWRIDEVNGAPDYAVFAGEVWNFTVEAVSNPVTPSVAIASSSYDGTTGPEKTIDGSGLDELDRHGTIASDMWLSGIGDTDVWIQYEFATAQVLEAMYVWNSNQVIESLVGFGSKTVTVETSLDGTTWTGLVDAPEFAQATGLDTYTANTVVDLGGVTARYVKLTVGAGWGTLGQFGLSEVRFMAIPTQPRLPEPATGVTGVAIDTTLSWRTGRQAASHEVSLSTDEQAVADGTSVVATVTESSYTPDDLQLGSTYYWKVDEVNEAEATSVWEGNVWSFATQEFLVVDDFESYDNADNVIYDTWIDGWINGTGSTVGYLEEPFAETETVHSGIQAMPLFYENTDSTVAEADLSLNQDWTINGIAILSLYFAGAEGNTGQLYVKINGTEVAYGGDAAAIADATWQVWNIDLTGLGVNLSNVTELSVGVEGAGAGGVVYIDDIRLYGQAPE